MTLLVVCSGQGHGGGSCLLRHSGAAERQVGDSRGFSSDVSRKNDTSGSVRDSAVFTVSRTGTLPRVCCGSFENKLLGIMISWV